MSFHIFQIFENQSLFTCGYNCESFLLSLLPLCSCLFSLSLSHSKHSLGCFRKVELGDGQKHSYAEAKMPGVLGIIQTWNNSQLVTFFFFLIFIYDSHTERERKRDRDTGRGRSRLPGLQDRALGQRQAPNRWPPRDPNLSLSIKMDLLLTSQVLYLHL